MLSDMWKDLRFALQLLARTPGFTISAILALALGIGANTAVFSVFDLLLLRPLPYAHSERIVKITGVNREQEVEDGQTSPADFLDWKTQSKVFDHLAAFRGRSTNLIGNGEPERLVGVYVTAGFFPLVGVEPALGRNFTSEEDSPAGPSVVILSHGFWKRRFASDPKIIGKTINLDGTERTVVGVLPQGFQFVELPEAEVWRPVGLGTVAEDPRDARYLEILGRFKQGTSLQEAQTEMDTLSARLEQQFKDTNEGWRVKLEPLQETLVRGIRPVLVVTLSSVALLLFISCANVANLLLARAASRQKEIAIRTALGAGRSRVVRQFLAESLLLAAAGVALGLLLAYWGLGFLAAAGPADIPRLADVGIDGRILAFVGLLTVITTLIFGLVPTFQVSQTQFASTLRESGRTLSQTRRQKRLRSALVIGEIALCLVVLIAAGLLLQTFRNLTRVDPGFEPKNLLTLQMVPNANYPEPGPRAAFLGEVLRRLEALPGVKSASEINFLPFTDGDSEDGIEIEGRVLPEGAELPVLHFRAVSPNYFRTMAIPVLRGNGFTEQDVTAPRTAVLNETAARQLWPGEDPVGRRIKHRSSEDWLTVSGIVGDVRHFGAASEPVAELYVLYPIDPYSRKTFILRTEGDPAPLANSARAAVWEVNRNQSVFDVRTMEEVMARSLAQSRFNATLITAFALSGLLLSAVGVYAVMAYSVGQRVQEIGIRMAMGATIRDVIRLILGESLGLALIGLVLGIAGALAATKILSGLLFGVGARDPLIFLGVSLLMVLVSLAAGLVPALRAARLDPVNVLQ